MLRFREDSLTQGLKTVEKNAGENFASGGQEGDSTVVFIVGAISFLENGHNVSVTEILWHTFSFPNGEEESVKSVTKGQASPLKKFCWDVIGSG